jgi:hypothetical protein
VTTTPEDLSTPMPLWCAGDPQAAIKLLDRLSEYDYTPADVLNHIDPDTCGYSLQTLWWWETARLFDPARLTGRTPRRLLYTRVDLSAGYNDRRPIERVTNTVSDTVLISSMRTDGSHQPALDLDYPSRLGRTDDGVLRLWLDPRSPALDYHGPDAINWADRALDAIGLTRSPRPTGTHWNDRSARGHLTAGLAATWQQPFETLLDATATLEDDQRNPLPDGGVWYEIAGDAWLIPSTTWWHLYLDTTVTESTYIAAVDAAAAAGLLNPGFANASRERGFTSLRRPGLRKEPRLRQLPTPEEDIPF